MAQKTKARNTAKSQITAQAVAGTKAVLPKKRKEDAKQALYINRI
jgi:hypothetical protein